VNALEAWLGSLPGQAYANVRQPPVSTLNLAHMIPLSAVWAGPAQDEHFQAPPLFFGKTEGSTPFRFSLHVGDVGHTLIVGPTGAARGVLLSLMAMAVPPLPRQPDSSPSTSAARFARPALSMGGDWHDLGGSLSADSDHSVSLQPLARIDDAAERAWAAEWVAAILSKVRRHDRSHRQRACLVGFELAGQLAGYRNARSTGLAVLLQSTALKQALQPTVSVARPAGC